MPSPTSPAPASARASCRTACSKRPVWRRWPAPASASTARATSASPTPTRSTTSARPSGASPRCSGIEDGGPAAARATATRRPADCGFALSALCLVAEVGLDLAGELDGERAALAVARVADREPYPLLAHAVFLDVVALHALEAHADAALEQRRIVVGARRVGRQPVWGRIAHGTWP